MNLTKTLKDQGYDLIDGLTRKHSIRQLWIKDPWDKVDCYYDDVNEAFISSINFDPKPMPGLDLVYSQKNSFKFNFGMSVAKSILEALGMNGLDLTLGIKTGKTVEISYSGSVSTEIPLGPILEYFSNADFHHTNPMLLKNLNQNNVIFISGAIFAKHLRIGIEKETEFEANVEADINEIMKGKFEVKLDSKKKLQLTSPGDFYFPVAVKAHKLRYRKGEFIDAELLTDRVDLF